MDYSELVQSHSDMPDKTNVQLGGRTHPERQAEEGGVLSPRRGVGHSATIIGLDKKALSLFIMNNPAMLEKVIDAKVFPITPYIDANRALSHHAWKARAATGTDGSGCMAR